MGRDFSAAAERALAFIEEDSVVGLGSGHAAKSFIRFLALRFKMGLRVRCVPTSTATERLAEQLGLPLTGLAEADPVHVTVDGADEVDPELNLIKGNGGALVRERIVAAASERLVILVDIDKMVPALGTHGNLPVEVVPFGLPFCLGELRKLGCRPAPRAEEERLFVTDNGNHILDCAVSAIPRPDELERAILAIPGVVDTGLFLGMADTVLIQDNRSVQVRERA